MSVSTKALTIAQWAKESKNGLQMGFTKSMLSAVSILSYLPLTTNPNISVKGGRITEDGLPTLGWGRVNKVPTDIKTTTELFEEQCAIIRARIQVDRKLMAQKDWIQDPVDTQVYGAMEAQRYQLNDAFFNGNPETDPDSIIGVRYRLLNPNTYKVASGLRINCSGLNLKDNMTASDGLKIREKLNEGFAYLGASEGENCYGFSNWLVNSRIEQAVMLQNAGAGFRSTTDNFDNKVRKYRECAFVDMGFKRGNTATPVIPVDELVGGYGTSGGDRSSLIICRIGGMHLKGWQDGPFKPEDLGRSSEYGTYNNMVLDWGMGLWHSHNRPFVELYGFEVS